MINDFANKLSKYLDEEIKDANEAVERTKGVAPNSSGYAYDLGYLTALELVKTFIDDAIQESVNV